MNEDSILISEDGKESTVATISTSRFGTIQISQGDLLRFPQGLIGFEDCHKWVLLADAGSSAVGWLQSATDEDLAVAVVSPRRFVPDYRFHVTRQQLGLIELDDLDRAFVLVVVGKSAESLTANLKAPVIVNLDRRLGCQIVADDDHPLQYTLRQPTAPLRKSA